MENILSEAKPKPVASGVEVYLGLGSNLGDRLHALSLATEALAAAGGLHVASSSIYETAPWGTVSPHAYLNQVQIWKTLLSPAALLAVCQHIERAMGRVKSTQNADRIIDIDILLYGDVILSEQGLHIPHSSLTERRFVLEPLAEIAPQCIVPGTGLSAQQLLLQCRDVLAVKHYTPLT